MKRKKDKTKGGAKFIETKEKMEIFGIDLMEYDEEYYLIGIDFFTRKTWISDIKNKKGETNF